MITGFDICPLKPIHQLTHDVHEALKFVRAKNSSVEAIILGVEAVCLQKDVNDAFRDALRFWAELHAASEPDVSDPVAMPVQDTDGVSEDDDAMDDSVSTWAERAPPTDAQGFAIPAPRPPLGTSSVAPSVSSTVELGPHTQMSTTPSGGGCSATLAVTTAVCSLWIIY